MAAKRISWHNSVISERPRPQELEVKPMIANDSFSSGESTPPPEPYDSPSGIDVQLLNILKKNYDIISFITDIERSDSPALSMPPQVKLNPPMQNLSDQDNSQDRSSPLPSVRHHRTRSIAVPSLVVREPPSSSSSSSESLSMADLNVIDEDSSAPESNTKEGVWFQLRTHWDGFVTEVSQALDETNEDVKARPPLEPPKLSAYALRRDIKRCLAESQPYIETANGLRDLFTWKNPVASLCLFFVYMYCTIRGWLTSLILFLILFQLILNYLTEHKNIKLGLYFLPRKEINIKRMDLSGAQLVFDVARRAQVLLTVAADIFEKAKALFTWKRPDVTFKFFMIILFFFVSSITFTTNTCMTVVGLALGGKAFITTYLFHRFPKLQRTFDVIIYFYDRLPTTRRLSESKAPSMQKQFTGSLDVLKVNWKTSGENLSKSPSTISIPAVECRRRSIGVIPIPKSIANIATPQLKRAVITEAPINTDAVPDEVDEQSTSDVECNDDMFIITRSCVIVDKDKPFPRGMSSGTLCLNEKMLGFRYQRVRDGIREMLQIPFSDIQSVRKIRTLNVFNLMPGASKALEIRLLARKKPIQFIGVPKRDEFYESLVEAARITGVELGFADEE